MRFQFSRMLRMCRLFALAVLAVGAVVAQAQPQKNVPVPSANELPTLRVLVLNNQRFEAVDQKFVKAVLSSAAEEVKRNFHVDVSFSAPDVTPLHEVLAKLPQGHRAWAEAGALDLAKPENVDVLRKTLADALLRNGGTLQDVRDFAAPYLISKPATTTEAAFADALAHTQVTLLSQLKALNAADGKPLLVADGAGEYLFWVALGYIRLPFEVVITNQLIASAERVGNSVHSALRGGVSNGLTNSSRSSRTGAFSVLSLYPFVSDDPVTKRLRNDKSYRREDAAKYAGAVLAHEIGHQLLHLGHPFDNPACLMRPPVRLHFQEWHASLDPKKCAVNSSDAMTPGRTVHFTDIR